MSKNKIRIAAFSLAAILFLLAGFGAHKTVILTIDGERQEIETFALTTGQLLKTEGISLAEEDQISPDLNRWLTSGAEVRIERAVPVVVNSDGQLYDQVSAERVPARLLDNLSIPFLHEDKLLYQGSEIDPRKPLPPASTFSLLVRRAQHLDVTVGSDVLAISSTAPSLGQALWEKGIILRFADRISLPLNTPLETASSANPSELTVQLDPSRELTIQSGGKEYQLRTTAPTVGEALVEAGLVLQGLDYTLPAPGDPVPINRRIRLVRVQERVFVEQAPIPFETEFQPVDDLELDQKSIVQTGEYGISATRIRVRYEDGQEVFRQEEGEWIAKEPVNRITGYGTMVVMHTTTASDGATINYWRALQMWATSYRPLETSNTTASGLPLLKGVAAVDTRYVPFGTRMYVPGYGEALAADRGGGVKGRWIDLGFSNEDYVSWHQWVTVYFLWPPPENILWIIP